MKRLRFSLLRSPKFWQRTIFSFALLASLAAAVYLVENYRGEAAWERYRSSAAARGVKLDFREFIPPPIADEENFMKAPLLRELGSPDPAVRAHAEEAAYLRRGSGAPGYPKGRNGDVVEFAAWQKYFAERGFIAKASDSAAAEVAKRRSALLAE